MSYMKMMAMAAGMTGRGGNGANGYGDGNGGMQDMRGMETRQNAYDNEIPIDAYRRIGFESRRRRGDDGRYMEMNEGGPGMAVRPYDAMGGMKQQGGQGVQFGGTFAMENPGSKKLTMEEAQEWVESMENEDEEHPFGGPFDLEMAKKLAEKVGVKTEGQRFIDFYAAINAIWSDYGKTFAKYELEDPVFYACLAKDWINDRDAVKNKAWMYYHCIVAK